MKHSFFRKLFLGSIGILILAFLAQWGFQQLWVERVLLLRSQNQIEQQLQQTSTRPSSLELQELMEQLTLSTGAYSSIIYPNEVQQQTLQLATMTIVDTNGQAFTILRPRTAMGTMRIGLNVQGTFYASNVADVYVPLELTIGARRLFGHQLNMNQTPELFQQLGVDTTVTYDIQGSIVQLNDLIIEDTQQALYNSEILNLMSQTNIQNVTRTDRWIRYQSLDELGNPLNLVYVTPLLVNQESLLLLTIYPLGTSRLISQSLATISIISLISAVIITSILYWWFFQRVSVPLQRVNEATKRFSSLDFATIPVYQSNDEIEDLSNNINLLSATLSSTLAELEERNTLLLDQLEQNQINERQRDELMTGISHELKTPLAILQASLEAIRLNVIGEDELPELQQTMSQEIERANQIIYKLLHLQDVSQLPSNQLEPIHLDEIVKAAIHQYTPLMEQRGCTINPSLQPTMIEANAQKMELVVSNLLSNAIKYSPTNSVITVEVTSQYLRLCNPTTLPEDTTIDDLFVPFHRMDKSRSRRDGSTGLGLSIVKQLLDQHHLSFECTITNETFCFMIALHP